MDSSILLDSSRSMAKSSTCFPSSSFPNLQSLLKDSTSRFLAEIQRCGGGASGTGDLSAFRAIFSRILHSHPDPPLEAIWFFSALSFHDSTAASGGISGRLTAVRDLLQFLSTCSASCPATAKSVALLAPAVSELHHCLTAAASLPSKESKKAKKEIESLVEAILSYISICSSKFSNGGESNAGCLLPEFGELVRVWSVRYSGEKDGFKVVFPLVGEEMRDRLRKDGCGVAYLAGVVVAETFLLRLCLKVQGDGVTVLRPELQKELRIWAVSSISVFQNRAFFVILLRMLHNAPLPVTSLLSMTEELLVRDILYDALILVDYSFIDHGVEVEHADDSLMPIFLTRLIVTYEAIQDSRSKGDQARAISYINAFATSSIPSYLTKWATHQVGFDKLHRPNAATPQALLKWLVDLEEKGLRVFGENISKLRKRLISDDAKIVSDNTMLDSATKMSDAELFFLDKQGRGAQEDVEAADLEMMDNAFMTAAQSMKVVTNGRRKRKEWGNEEGSKVKFVKYDIEDSLVKDYVSSAADGMSSGSEVENPPSDDEMEETE